MLCVCVCSDQECFFGGGGRYITCLCKKNSTGPNIARAGSYVCSVFASISDKGTNVIVQRIIVRDERSPSRDDLFTFKKGRPNFFLHRYSSSIALISTFCIS